MQFGSGLPVLGPLDTLSGTVRITAEQSILLALPDRHAPTVASCSAYANAATVRLRSDPTFVGEARAYSCLCRYLAKPTVGTR
jgi:hypothetical protein